MVTTRGQQPARASAEVASEKTVSIDPAILVESSELLNPNPETYEEEEVETIGSRLRKRRRTGSLSSPRGGGAARASKKSPPKIAISPDSKKKQASISTKEDAHSNAPPPAPSITPSSTDGLSAPPPETAANGHEDLFLEPGVERNKVDDESTERARDADLLGPSSLSQEHAPVTAVTPDLAALIRKIVERGEAIDRRYGEMGYVDTESYLPLGASMHLKTQCLPILDNLSTQILNTLAKSTYHEILKMSTDPESDSAQAYTSLKSLFNHTKKVYSIEEHFLSPYELGLVEGGQLDTIRKANMATYISSVFGSQDVGFYYLNEYFLDTFVTDGNRLLKSQGQLFLDLKTHAYISASSSGQHSREELLEDLFPPDLEERLLSRRPGAKQLAPSEADFLKRARNRSKSLLEDSRTEESIAALPEKYIWEDYLRDVRAYVIKNFQDIAGTSARKVPRASKASNFFIPDVPHSSQSPQIQQGQHIQPRAEQNVEHSQARPLIEGSHQEPSQIPIDTDNIAAKAARAAQFAIQGFNLNQAALEPHHPQLQPPMHQANPQQQQFQYQFEHQAPQPQFFPYNQYQAQQTQHSVNQQPVDMNQQHQVYANQNAIPYPTQSAPTKDLYARARAAASAKASPTSRRAGHPSQRRPWTTDEENALMQGLDCVKGPHWSQILAMFGPGGAINEILKDRNQVQLKDKARNLKLFFLKSQIEVPYYLSFVTGELKTRAPAQAAKNEAKEKEKISEERAQVEGGMALDEGSTHDGEVLDEMENGGEKSFKREVVDDTDGLETVAGDGSDEEDIIMDGEPPLDDEEYHRAQLQYEGPAQVNGDHGYTNGLLEASQLEADKDTDDEAELADQLTCT